MGKIKKLFVVLGLAFSLVGGGVVYDVATSHNTAKAEAVTWTQGPIKYQWDWYKDPYNGQYYCGVWAYNDYNWWEETFQGKRDGWEREWYALC